MQEELDQLENFPLLGYTVWWKLTGIHVEHDELEKRMISSNLDDFIPSRPSYRKCLRRALEHWQRDNRKNGSKNKKKSLIRTINNQANPDWMVFVLVGEKADLDSLGLEHATDLRILLKKTDGTLIVTTTDQGMITAANEALALKNQLMPYYHQYLNVHQSTDLSRTVINIVQSLGAVTIRDQGGLYFVPVSKKQELQALLELIETLPTKKGTQPYFISMPIPDALNAKRQMATAVYNGMIDEVESLKSDLQRISAETVRPKTITEKVKIYKQVMAKAATYADVLGMKRNEIINSLKALQVAAQQMIST